MGIICRVELPENVSVGLSFSDSSGYMYSPESSLSFFSLLSSTAFLSGVIMDSHVNLTGLRICAKDELQLLSVSVRAFLESIN